MSTEAIERPASDRQMAYIRRLQTEMGEQALVINEDVSSVQASMIIGELIAKSEKRNGANSHVKINEPRLGMAMKECFREWKRWGWDMFRDEEKKGRFINEVITTYGLFTEIAEKMSQKCHNTR